jgi:hypothetical protein
MLLPSLPAQDRRTSAGAAAGRIFFGQERAGLFTDLNARRIAT